MNTRIYIGLFVMIVLALLFVPVAAQDGYPGPATATVTAVGYPAPATTTPTPTGTAVPVATPEDPTNIGVGGVQAESGSESWAKYVFLGFLVFAVMGVLFLSIILSRWN
jgi:hypothetical protein